MTEQLALVPPEVKLTDRQRAALDYIENAGGLTSTELGLLMHARRGKHPADKPCAWCEDEGRHVAVELRGKGLVVHRRTGKWESLRARPAAETSAQTNRIPF